MQDVSPDGQREDSDSAQEEEQKASVSPPGAAVEAKQPSRRCRKAAGGFLVHTAACVGKSSKDLYSAVASELGWREKDVEAKPPASQSPARASKDTIFCVMQTSDLLDRLPTLGPHSWVTRYVGCPDLCDKGNFARMVFACRDLCEPDTFDFIPKTWVLPEQTEELRALMEKSKKTYIIKPDDGSQGDGIVLVQGLRDLDIKLSTKAHRAAVVQRYLEKPLLLGGVKFDLRVYVLLVGGSTTEAPRTYVCREGLARFCTESYEEPTARNMHRCMAHLTNYSLNKRSEKFEHSGDTLEEVFSPSSSASKRPLTMALRQVQAEYSDFDPDAFYASVVSLVGTTIAVMAPALSAYHRGHCPEQDMPCCQVLGFDIILKSNFQPVLLEVNNSPSLCIDEALPLEPGDPRLKDRAARLGRPREREGKVCCCMDMSQPHFHQTALVDLAVKRTAVCGAFRLLEQLKDGIDEPEVDEYLQVEVDSDLHRLLQRIEALFAHAGGGAKAFTSSGMRRLLGSVCGRGSLEKHDLDMLSVRFRSTNFVVHDRSVKAEALRLFDFVNLLHQVAARAFPASAPRASLQELLASLGR